MRRRFDAIVIGGGPAGSGAARLLARWEHSVLLLTKPPSTPVAESIPPSCQKLLAEFGVLDAVEATGFYRGRGNTVWWGAATHSETFENRATAYQVERPAFDALLLDLASQAGVVVRRNATVRDVRPADQCAIRNPKSAIDRWPPDTRDMVVSYERQGKRAAVEATWVLDCSGRAGVLARRGLRREEPGQATVSLYRKWRRDGAWGLADETHTLVESYRDGWAWSIPVAPGERYFAVMVDPMTTGLEPGRRLDAIYCAELAKTTRLRPLLDGSTPSGRPRGLGASPYSARRYAGPRWLLVGDAGSFIDPLSSFGVKKALASAWLAAVAVHTAIVRPEMERAALDLFDAREHDVYAAYQRLGARYFEDGAGTHGHAFWEARSRVASLEEPHSPAEPDVALLREDPAVLAAFERLKRQDEVQLRPSDGLHLVERPAVRDHLVVLEPQLTAAWCPRGIRFLRSVDLVRLVELAPQCRRVPDLFEAHNQSAPPAALPDFLGALSLLLARGALIDASAPERYKG